MATLEKDMLPSPLLHVVPQVDSAPYLATLLASETALFPQCPAYLTALWTAPPLCANREVRVLGVLNPEGKESSPAKVKPFEASMLDRTSRWRSNR